MPLPDWLAFLAGLSGLPLPDWHAFLAWSWLPSCPCFALALPACFTVCVCPPACLCTSLTVQVEGHQTATTHYRCMQSTSYIDAVQHFGCITTPHCVLCLQRYILNTYVLSVLHTKHTHLHQQTGFVVLDSLCNRSSP